jgi:hypothetical protein
VPFRINSSIMASKAVDEYSDTSEVGEMGEGYEEEHLQQLDAPAEGTAVQVMSTPAAAATTSPSVVSGNNNTGRPAPQRSAATSLAPQQLSQQQQQPGSRQQTRTMVQIAPAFVPPANATSASAQQPSEAVPKRRLRSAINASSNASRGRSSAPLQASTAAAAPVNNLEEVILAQPDEVNEAMPPVALPSAAPVAVAPPQINMNPRHELTRLELAYFGVRELPELIHTNINTATSYYTVSMCIMMGLFIWGLISARTIGLVIMFIVWVVVFVVVQSFYNMNVLHSLLQCCCWGSMNERMDEFQLSTAYFIWKAFLSTILQMLTLTCICTVLYATPFALRSRVTLDNDVLNAINALDSQGMLLFIISILGTFFCCCMFIWFAFVHLQVISQLQKAFAESPAVLDAQEAALANDPLTGVMRVRREPPQPLEQFNGLGSDQQMMAGSMFVLLQRLFNPSAHVPVGNPYQRLPMNDQYQHQLAGPRVPEQMV